MRRWKRENREEARAQNRLRRDRIRRGSDSSLTPKALAALLRSARGRCVYCAERAQVTTDHFVPVARGGQTTASNVVAACARCNTNKNAREPHQWVLETHGVVALAAAKAFMRRR